MRLSCSSRKAFLVGGAGLPTSCRPVHYNRYIRNLQIPSNTSILQAEMSKLLIPAQRHERIRDLLEAQNVVSNTELGQLLGVSEATIRRDLQWLEKQGILERTHGGATPSQRVTLEPGYATRAPRHPQA